MDSKSFRVGLSVLAAIFTVYLFLSWTQQRQLFGTQTTTYHIQFDQIGGLLEGDPVFIRGYEVGKVADIQFTPTQILVDIQIQQEVALAEDAYAEIMMKDLMGSKALSLHPGSAHSLLNPTQIIPGKGGADWGKLMNSVNTLATILEKEDVNGWLIKSEKLLDELIQGTQLLTSDTLSSLLLSVTNTSDQAGKLLQRAQEKQLVDQVSSTLTQIESLSTQIDSLTQSLLPFTNALSPEWVQASDSVLSSITPLLAQTENLLSQGDSFFQALERQQGLLGRTIYNRELSNRLDSTLTLFEEVLIRLKDERIRVGIALSKEKEAASQKP